MRYSRGQSMVEVAVGSLVMVPVALAIIDLAMVAIGGNVIADLSKQSARAAANASNATDAAAAVNAVVSKFTPSSTFKNLSVKLTRYDTAADGLTTVQASVTVVLPVSIPLLSVSSEIPLKTQATEAVVGIAPLPPPPP